MDTGCKAVVEGWFFLSIFTVKSLLPLDNFIKAIDFCYFPVFDCHKGRRVKGPLWINSLVQNGVKGQLKILQPAIWIHRAFCCSGSFSQLKIQKHKVVFWTVQDTVQSSVENKVL